MIYLIKYLYEDLYYCTNDTNEYNDIMYKHNVIPGTAILLDITDVSEIKDRDKCDGIIDTGYKEGSVSSFQRRYENINEFTVYETEDTFYVNFNNNETIKLSGLITCIGVYIKSKEGGLIGFHYVDETLDENKIPQALSLMKMNNMTTENSTLLLYYVPNKRTDVHEKQIKTINFIKEHLGFETNELISGNESSVIYGITPSTISSRSSVTLNYMYDKPSAYKSMQLSKLGLTKPTTKKNKGALIRWTKEKWINLNALKDKNIILPCGSKYKGQTEPTVCRPSKKISEKTPKPLAKNLTSKQIQKAIKIKKKEKRISWKDL
jgi:hypothetical protein